tara:strand:+ start:436 stop:678 length:243 start_codon:yes stop_codon:yes gene_type:complete
MAKYKITFELNTPMKKSDLYDFILQQIEDNIVPELEFDYRAESTFQDSSLDVSLFLFAQSNKERTMSRIEELKGGQPCSK